MRWHLFWLLLFVAIVLDAIGVRFVLGTIEIVASWAYALPKPTEQFASLLGDFAWPLAIIILALMFWRPLDTAARHLANRFRKGRIKLGSWLEIDDVEVIELDGVDLGTGELSDRARTEKLLEVAGETEQTWQAFVHWIDVNVIAGLDIEEFLISSEFADRRKDAYIHFVNGEADG